jgi:hypothetical protein
MMDRYYNAEEYSKRLYDDNKTQKEMCLEYLEKYGSITPLEALTAFNSFRLSALIFELRKEGYIITTKLNEDGKKFAIYTLLREGDE